MAIELGNSTSLRNLIYYYEYKEKNPLLIKDILYIFINNGFFVTIPHLKTYYKTDIKLYNFFKNINTDKNDKYNTQIEELSQKESVLLYISKIRNSNTISECFVCYEIKLLIPFECGHIVCSDCYTNMNKCYYNCR